MKPELTIVYITSRFEPRFSWFLDSLLAQTRKEDDISILLVDSQMDTRPHCLSNEVIFHFEPKPTVWSGKHRVTKQDWWSASNQRNSGICRCETDWIAFLDDRCVLLPGWLDGVRRAMAGNYCVAGWYQKRTGMTVESGIIKHAGIIAGEDSRDAYLKKMEVEQQIYPAPGEWTYGCSLAMPLEWALAVNGFDETMDGASGEDGVFGLMLQNNGFPILYDRTMQMIEDRTPSASLPVMRREDKGVSPNDKSHFLLNLLRGMKSSLHPIDLRKIRADVLAGKPFPPPWGPERDIFDNQLISEFT